MGRGAGFDGANVVSPVLLVSERVGIARGGRNGYRGTPGATVVWEVLHQDPDDNSEHDIAHGHALSLLPRGAL